MWGSSWVIAENIIFLVFTEKKPEEGSVVGVLLHWRRRKILLFFWGVFSWLLYVCVCLHWRVAFVRVICEPFFFLRESDRSHSLSVMNSWVILPIIFSGTYIGSRKLDVAHTRWTSINRCLLSFLKLGLVLFLSFWSLD